MRDTPVDRSATRQATAARHAERLDFISFLIQIRPTPARYGAVYIIFNTKSRRPPRYRSRFVQKMIQIPEFCVDHKRFCIIFNIKTTMTDFGLEPSAFNQLVARRTANLLSNGRAIVKTGRD